MYMYHTYFFQILLTQDSSRVHREVLKNMPILRRLARTKLDDQQVKLMCSILDDLAEYVILYLRNYSWKP